MKILIFIDHLGEGGAERVASVLANKFSASSDNEINITLFVDKINYVIDNIDKNVKINILKSDSNKFKRICNRVSGYIDVMKSFKPDIIYALGNVVSIYAVIAKKLSGCNCKLVVSERTDPSREPGSQIAKKLRNICYGMADVLVCQTEYAKKYFPMYIQKKSVVIPNPISPDLYEWNGIDSKTIICACRLEKQKNLYMLLDAYKMLHDKHSEFVLDIYGNGSMYEELQKYIIDNQLQNSVNLKGFSKDIKKLMSESYMYVSSSDYEGISNSMLEALGTGIPSVCTDCPVYGARMFINSGENGLLVDTGDVNGFYEAMLRIIDDKKLAMSFSEKSVEINKKISVDVISKKWIELASN